MDDLPEEVRELIESLDEATEDEDEDTIEELTRKLLDTGIDMKPITLEKLSLLVMNGEEEMSAGWTRVALQVGLDPLKTLLKGLAAGMSLIGEKYARGEAYVPHLLLSSSAMYGGMDILKPYLKQDESGAKPATVVIGSAEGDIHDIGKNLVKTLLSANGFNCVDLGNDVPADQFIEAAKEQRATALSISTLMTTTMGEMPKVVKMLEDEGIRDKVLVMVGGAPITAEYAAQIGADASPDDAIGAANWLKGAIFDFASEAERWG
ncbi:corrinoid protein [Methanosarcina sp. 1.H.A.2.2]|uniref:corrinoid protein n=1 Tax=Methanosarcina sp. 1.H.A.2.2 TaxID=1483601 RepID=UPI0006213B32|nr:corrinoid protein [Methanosarcina sp. 1.H.A.2.2]KKH50186.1 corrinoid protein [Methanosarcina sp. 1.H.A.2.2]